MSEPAKKSSSWQSNNPYRDSRRIAPSRNRRRDLNKSTAEKEKIILFRKKDSKTSERDVRGKIAPSRNRRRMIRRPARQKEKIAPSRNRRRVRRPMRQKEKIALFGNRRKVRRLVRQKEKIAPSRNRRRIRRPAPQKGKVIEFKKAKKAMEKEQKQAAKRERKISKPVTIPEGRLTEPKKRSLLRRIMLQSSYSRGAFDYIEEDYLDDTITPEEIEASKNATKRGDRKLYKKVQAYEDARDDVTVRKGWLAFKVSLAAVLLCTSIGMYNHIIKDIHNSAPQPAVIITLDEANREQIADAGINLNIIKEDCGYRFDNLTVDEQLDATLRIPVVEGKIPAGRFKNALLSMKDQELLDEIVMEAYGEEYGNFSEQQKSDLRKLAYQLLDDEQKDNTRDPIYIEELQAKREAEAQEIARRNAEVQARHNGDNITNDSEKGDDR